jgi:hypothetical protein
MRITHATRRNDTPLPSSSPDTPTRNGYSKRYKWYGLAIFVAYGTLLTCLFCGVI